MIETVRFVLRDLTRSKLRTFLTLIGIFIGMTAVVALTSLSIGLRESILSEIESLGTNRIMITMGEGTSQIGPPGSSSIFYQGFSPEDVKAVENTRGVDNLVTLRIVQTNLEYKDNKASTFVAGFPKRMHSLIEDERIIEFKSGRMLGQNERRSVIIGKLFSEQTFDREIGLRENVKIGDKFYTVVGIIDAAPNPLLLRGALVHEDVARELKGNDNIDIMVAITEEDIDPEIVKERIIRRLENSRDDDDFSATTASEMIELVERFTGILNAVLGGIAGISLIVGGLGITNTMYMSVTEKRKEIGIMKAIGATDWQILSQFLMQSAILGIIGGLVGITLGFSISKVIEVYVAGAIDNIDYQSSTSPYITAFVLLFSAVLGAFAGAMPAKRAAELPPVEAIRR